MEFLATFIVKPVRSFPLFVSATLFLFNFKEHQPFFGLYNIDVTPIEINVMNPLILPYSPISCGQVGSLTSSTSMPKLSAIYKYSPTPVLERSFIKKAFGVVLFDLNLHYE